jgi:hypothetical protein
MCQLLLFEESKEEKLDRKIQELEDKIERNRKGQWATISKLKYDVKSLTEQLEFLQSNIARKGYYL